MKGYKGMCMSGGKFSKPWQVENMITKYSYHDHKNYKFFTLQPQNKGPRM